VVAVKIIKQQKVVAVKIIKQQKVVAVKIIKSYLILKYSTARLVNVKTFSYMISFSMGSHPLGQIKRKLTKPGYCTGLSPDVVFYRIIS
jgi:hypothetical protein